MEHKCLCRIQTWELVLFKKRLFWEIVWQIHTFSLRERFRKVLSHLLKRLSMRRCNWSTFLLFKRVFQALFFIFLWFHHESYLPIRELLNHNSWSKTYCWCWSSLDDVEELVHWHQECLDLLLFLWLKTPKILHFLLIDSLLREKLKFIQIRPFR